jgi:hypothetical protein
MDEDDINDLLWEASYGVTFDSSISWDVTFNVFDVFTYNLALSFVPIEVTPLTQYITFSRPDIFLYNSFDFTAYEVTFTGTYDIEYGDFTVSHTPDTLVTSVSLYDTLYTIITGGSTTIDDYLPTSWALQEDDDVSFDDSYLSVNLFEEIYNYLGIDLTLFQGETDWYSVTFSL